MDQTETIHILGAGSIGMLWATHLALSGKHVFLIPRTPQKTAVQTLSLTHQQQQYSCSVTIGQPATDDVIQTLLVCTKAYDVLSACQALSTQLHSQCRLLLLQNGMGFQQAFAQSLPQINISIGVSTEGAFKQSASQIIHTGIGHTTIGALDKTQNLKSQQEAHWLDTLSCKLQLGITNDIARFQWRKIAINSVINPLTVLYDCNNGELQNLPQAQKTLSLAVAELKNLAYALNISEYFRDIDALIIDVIAKTAANSSSMREDIRCQRRSEIHFINGFIVQQAQQLNIECPTQTYLLNAIEQRESVYSST